MPLKIPTMQYDKRILPEKGRQVLDFADKYVTSFQDNMVETTLNKVISNGFFGKGQFEILMKRREQFSDDEIKDPEFFYIQKYKKVISRLVATIESNNFTNPNKTDLPKLNDLLDFFKRQGYLTKKQMSLISFLLKDCPTIQTTTSQFKTKISQILHHHIKKDFMKAKTITELAEVLTDIKEKSKEAQPKKKMFFSLSQIRSELSN